MCYILFGTRNAQQHWYIKKIINLCMFFNLHSAFIWSCGLEKNIWLPITYLCTSLNKNSYVYFQGPSYCSLIYNYLCKQCLLPLTVWVRIMARCTTLCDNFGQWLATCRCFFPDTPVPPPIKLTATIKP